MELKNRSFWPIFFSPLLSNPTIIKLQALRYHNISFSMLFSIESEMCGKRLTSAFGALWRPRLPGCPDFDIFWLVPWSPGQLTIIYLHLTQLGNQIDVSIRAFSSETTSAWSMVPYQIRVTKSKRAEAPQGRFTLCLSWSRCSPLATATGQLDTQLCSNKDDGSQGSQDSLSLSEICLAQFFIRSLL